MPVRSRGSLLAGTAALAGLIVAGLGCHSSYSDHDAFSIPSSSAQANGSPPARHSIASTPAGYPAQPVNAFDPTPSLNPLARPVTLQPVPTVQPAVAKREVIASNWSPVQRVSAEQSVQEPDVQGRIPPVAISSMELPRRIAFTSGSQMPNGSSPIVGSGPLLDGSESAPGNIVLPQPRPLRAMPSSAFVPSGSMPPPHPHPYADVPREFEKMALPSYVVEPPDVLLIQASNRITLRLQQIQGQHLVGPDGTVNLGIYGKVRVAGLTIEQVADAVAARLLEIMPDLLKPVPELDDKGKEKRGTEGAYVQEWRRDFSTLQLIKLELQVDVLAYNSKFYYVITDGGGYGQQVTPIPIKGNETVLDALANINGLPPVASKNRVWVARATRAGQPPKIMPVDWKSVAQCGSSATNYQIFPGDRIYVDSNHLIKADSFLSKLYSPILRTFGVTLLGASTVNTIKLGRSSGLGSGLGVIR